jgi:hypothetical protein
MSTTTITFDQTFEQMANMWDDIAGWIANFANGVVGAIGKGVDVEAVTLSRIRAEFPIAINAASASRELAIAAGDTTAAKVCRN